MEAMQSAGRDASTEQSRAFVGVRNVFTSRYFVTLAILVFSAMPAFAQSVSVDVDTDTFISAINQWLPLALALTAIGVGIAGAFALANMVGRMIIDAFNGRVTR